MIVLLKQIILLSFCFLLFPVKGWCYSAQSAIVMEQKTRQVLFESNAYEQLGMASTTKIMTAIVVLEHALPNEIVTVSQNAVGVEGSSMWLEAEEKITVENLLYGLMLNSGNDAAVALAEYVGGTVDEFCNMMNRKAKQIGATQTKFVNPNGLPDEEHYTTAFDLALITCYALDNETFREIVSTRERNIPWPGREYDKKLVNHNKLLKLYNGCNGVKTGFTKSTGRALVSSAEKDGTEIVAVTLNAPDDWNDHKKMLDTAFESYRTEVALPKNEYIMKLPVQGGKKEFVPIVSENSLFFLQEKEKIIDYTVKKDAPEYLEAPITSGQKVGRIFIESDGVLLCESDLIAAEEVEEDNKKKLFIFLFELLQIWMR